MNYNTLKSPNLPEGPVAHVAVCNSDSCLIDKLTQLNIKMIKTIPSDNLDKRIKDHTDMLVLQIDKNTVLSDKSQEENNVNFLTIGYKQRIIKKSAVSPYPYDSLLNILLLGDKLIYCDKTADPEILEIFKNTKTLIPVKQGYIKCSACVVNANAVITDDRSIYNALDKNGIDTLLVNKGSIKLKGFDYGFIGGCTGLIDKNKLLFNGDINYHSDCNSITDFLLDHNVEPVIIKNKPLNDIGGIIPLTEYNNTEIA